MKNQKHHWLRHKPSFLEFDRHACDEQFASQMVDKWLAAYADQAEFSFVICESEREASMAEENTRRGRFVFESDHKADDRDALIRGLLAGHTMMIAKRGAGRKIIGTLGSFRQWVEGEQKGWRLNDGNLIAPESFDLCLDDKDFAPHWVDKWLAYLGAENPFVQLVVIPKPGQPSFIELPEREWLATSLLAGYSLALIFHEGPQRGTAGYFGTLAQIRASIREALARSHSANSSARSLTERLQ